MGEWCVTGVAFWSIISLIGGLSISGSALCSQVLNMLEA